jgi:glycosyltransferase involved in cell wall biosynthesis
MTVRGRKRLLMVARGRYAFPLDKVLSTKLAALEQEFDLRVLGAASSDNHGTDPRFTLSRPFPVRRLDGPAFYVALPVRVARELRRFRPDAVLAQGAHETAAVLLARRVARVPTRVILDLHGDWRAPTRLYGSRLRRLLGPLGDAVARGAVRGADAVRTISDYTTGLVRELGVEPQGAFPAFMDVSAFVERPPQPLPQHPSALFVGVLERYKNVDGLAAAWRMVAPRLPDARLQLVGSGSLAEVVESLVRDLPGRTAWSERLDSAGIAAALDSSTFLVLPSRSEGMGRVIVEAFLRGRPVLGTRVGGICDLVHDGVNGLLVPSEDVDALADALVRLLGEPDLAAQLAAGALESAEQWLQTPELYAARVRALVEDDAPARG